MTTYSSTRDRWAVTTDNGPHMPARRTIAVAPSDTLDVSDPAGDNAPCYASSLYVGVSGNIAVVAAGDTTNNGAGTPVTFPNVPVGWFPVQVRRVMATNTSASSIVGLYHQ